MDPILHWHDIGLDPGLAELSEIIFVIGVVYFAYSYWRLKRRRPKDSEKEH
jgi:hypothetical protein